MRPLTIASALALLASPMASADPQTAKIYIQPVGGNPSDPVPLADITYDLSSTTDSSAEVTSYEFPDLEFLGPSSSLLRIGAYDPATGDWTGATSVASSNNFGKGYAPHFLVMVDGDGDGGNTVVGASLRGVRIDAGQTRDFGPQARIVRTARGRQPELNRPVVLSKEGRREDIKEEKTFLQKYWWMIGIALFIALGGGGGDGK